MISVKEADDIIHRIHYQPAMISVSLDHALGMVLGTEVTADRDLPPFNRATMDGVAIHSASFAKGIREFDIVGVQPAGVRPAALKDPGQCVEIMTGAVVPHEADAVIPYEDVSIHNGKAAVKTAEVSAGQNIHYQGKDAIKGSVVLSPGRRISAAEVALFASVGLTEVKVYATPSVAVVSTGDELVPVNVKPEPWQLRTSNGHALSAALQTMGIPASMLHLSDNVNTIAENVRRILDEHDVIIMSGGVSKGKFDYVPDALVKNGVQKQFHQISQRPGKPLWFGRGNGKTVFALPGNPVSTFMCFYRYVKPWIERSLHLTPSASSATLGSDFQFKPQLTYFLQVNVRFEAGRLVAMPDAGGGSGDFTNLTTVDGFLELPMEKSDFKSGEVFPYFPFRT